MTTEKDDHFYDRADAHIHLANDQTKDTGRGKVSASFLYGAARFNVHVAACNCESKHQMINERDSIRDYYVAEYTKMLEEHLDDYVEHYDRYMRKDT
ncbi:DUF3144 domain-containing protein [Pseudoxanthomonas sp. SE1]|uniref:DUF3144 domain-containing protein n=1 Tax=Pseudoxanthomonas sp. SE1 TaxID=1664560 RepID=UPI00240D3024|nr:DUF3144 domain-containing protein [Pseudoxanthomonas sp. SE1]WFC41354.1 DUF3144 domain-containing protein [Pseudoxanthomonas sp. SE1]